MGKRGSRNGTPQSDRAPVAAAPAVVELTGEARLRMENLLLERDLLDERKKNLGLRRTDLDREALELDAQIETNTRVRDEFVAARGFDVSGPVLYGDGKLSKP